MKNKENWGKNNYGYKPFAEWVWKNYDGTDKINLADWIEEHKGSMFFIGTDSQNYKKHNNCVFTSVLIAYKMRHGGSVVMHRDKCSMISALRQRLMMEAMRSLEVAWYVDGLIANKDIICVHLDVNSNLKFKSGQYKNELISLVASQGFNFSIKPDSFAASKVADNKC
jgi:predicted RNase H-related nuclease YkuK (DUF458 family)